MNKKEFFEELGKTGKGSFSRWYIGNREHIRIIIKRRHYSPITAVCKQKTGKFFKVSQWKEATKALGLRSDFAKRLQWAYESETWALMQNSEEAILKLRRRIMRICEI